jgi:osmotically-inducible protein OsmY
VQTFKGQVTLTGIVENPLQKREAESIAREVEGVTGVNNQVQVMRVRSPMRW